MPEDPTGETTAEASTATAAEDGAADEPIDWDSLDASLERAYTRDPKTASDRLKKHRAIGGIAGSIAERRLQEFDQQRGAERQAEAARAAAAELEDMAQNRPLEFADKFLNIRTAEKTRAQISAVEQNAAMKIMEQIGNAYRELDEFADLTDAEKGRLRDAVADASDGNVLPKFNRVALEIVADRRAEKKMADRLVKEKEAWRQEYEGERLGKERGPDLRRATRSVSKPLNWADMSDKDFADYWKKRYG